MPPLPLYVLPWRYGLADFFFLSFYPLVGSHAEGVHRDAWKEDTYPVVRVGSKVPDYLSLVVEDGFGLDLEATHGRQMFHFLEDGCRVGISKHLGQFSCSWQKMGGESRLLYVISVTSLEEGICTMTA